MHARRPRRRPLLALAALALVALAASACSKPLEAPTAKDGAPTTLPKPTRTYVALGDSYSAGGGVPPYRADGTPCLRSDNAWPVLLAAPAKMDLLACGGATIDSLLRGVAEVGLAPQLPGGPTPGVELVTFTLGLNDVDFFQFVVSCVQSDCLTAGGDPGLVAAGLERVRTGLVQDVYPTLRERFPDARIVHVGYPQVLPASADAVVGCPWLSEAERQFIRSYQDQFQAMLARAVAEAAPAEVELVDTSAALAGGELCTDGTQFVPMDKPDGSGGHMSAKGYVTFADAVRAALARSTPAS